ncbi:MAG: nickel-responsive transcriptional regulator NikR [Candidatus Bipolaricaulaceae bacterium]
MARLVRFGVSMEAELLGAFDELVRKKGYTNRSEALRDLVREALSGQAWAEGKEVLGVIVLLYDHRKRELLARLTQAQHHAPAQVLASLHIHLDEENCLEVVAVRGPAAEVEELADRLRAEKGVKLGRLCAVGHTALPQPPCGLGRPAKGG